MEGPGKYDQFTTDIRERTGAQAVVLVVVGGTVGHGFDVQIAAVNRDEATEILKALVVSIRGVAEVIEKDTTEMLDEGGR